MTPTKDSPVNLLKLDKNKIETFTKLPQSKIASKLTGDLLTFNSSDVSEASQHTCHPSPDTLLKADNENTPNDADVTELSNLDKIIPHCNEQSELKRWKDKVRKLHGTEIKIMYDKRNKLSVTWKIEDFVGNKNIHEDEHQYLPIFESTKMPTNHINPIKNFMEVFPESEMKLCVDRFNNDMLDEATKSWLNSGQKK